MDVEPVLLVPDSRQFVAQPYLFVLQGLDGLDGLLPDKRLILHGPLLHAWTVCRCRLEFLQLGLCACHVEHPKEILLELVDFAFLLHRPTHKQFVEKHQYHDGRKYDEDEHEVAVLVGLLQLAEIAGQAVVLIDVAVEPDADIVVVPVEWPVVQCQSCQRQFVAQAHNQVVVGVHTCLRPKQIGCFLMMVDRVNEHQGWLFGMCLVQNTNDLRGMVQGRFESPIDVGLVERVVVQRLVGLGMDGQWERKQEHQQTHDARKAEREHTALALCAPNAEVATGEKGRQFLVLLNDAPTVHQAEAKALVRLANTDG